MRAGRLRPDPEAAEQLAALRDREGAKLSSRSIDLLSLAKPGHRRDFVRSFFPHLSFDPTGSPAAAGDWASGGWDENLPKQDTVVTCMEALTKVGQEPDSVSSLVVGTESQKVLILDPTASSVACAVDLPGVPVFLAITGEFDVEWRIVVACRDGKVRRRSGSSSQAFNTYLTV